MSKDYFHEIEAWRVQREASLRARDSWLALADLYWLEEGENLIGFDPTMAWQLPGLGPRCVGVLCLQNGEVTLQVREQCSVCVDGDAVSQAVLRPDSSGNPSRITLDELTLIVIERDGRFGMRLWNNARSQRETFPGCVWFPVQPDLRIPARFLAYPEQNMQRILDVKGNEREVHLCGRVTFKLQGQVCTLDAMGDPEKGLFLIFRDESNGESTYSAGRFLSTEPVSGDQVWLDFNRTYNPPCAVTPYATCPLPPQQNRLPLALEAGERFASHT